MEGKSTPWNHGKHFVLIVTGTGGIFQDMLPYSWCTYYWLVIRESSFARVWWGQTVLQFSCLSDLFWHMLLDAVEKALGRTTHIPTLAVAYEFVDSLAFDMSRKYVLLNNVQQRSSGENLFRFHRGVATLYRMFYLLFKPIRHVTYLGWTVVTVKLAPANRPLKML